MTNLESPDIIALEEVQDNDGATNDGIVAADQTLDKLIDAITAAGGPAYAWRQIDPVNDADGGEPGGNIRVGVHVPHRQGLEFVDRPGARRPRRPRSHDRRPAALSSRRPGRPGQLGLDGQPQTAGRRVHLAWPDVFVIANHFNPRAATTRCGAGTSRRCGPPRRSGTSRRRRCAASSTRSWPWTRAPTWSCSVTSTTTTSPPTADTWSARARALNDLPATLPLTERYTYVYEGNIAGPRPHPDLVAWPPAYGYDVVHINSEFADQISDHDPQVVAGHPPPVLGALTDQRSDAYGLSGRGSDLLRYEPSEMRVLVRHGDIVYYTDDPTRGDAGLGTTPDSCPRTPYHVADLRAGTCASVRPARGCLHRDNRGPANTRDPVSRALRRRRVLVDVKVAGRHPVLGPANKGSGFPGMDDADTWQGVRRWSSGALDCVVSAEVMKLSGAGSPTRPLSPGGRSARASTDRAVSKLDGAVVGLRVPDRVVSCSKTGLPIRFYLPRRKDVQGRA